MTCPGCSQENPAGARFCGGCGAPLEVICVACQAPNPPGNRFCHQCGGVLGPGSAAGQFASPQSYTPKHLAEKILTTGSALKGERKQVTVLFVDVSGFTSLSERLDPEEVHRLMSRAFDLMLAEVHRYEGTVNQFLGDGIMALFGAPIAHEDHARRAVHAALGIGRALEAYQTELAPRGISFRARQGLNTGLVVVGSIGSDLRMDYTAVGDTTNVAARLQQAGEPGRVTISEATHRLVRGYFETRPLGELHLKGKAESVAAWEVVAAHETRTRLEVEADRGLTPFVGRERELGSLVDAFERARAGQGQVAFLVGEAGIGKSRLLLELRRRVADGAAWQEGHCLSFGKAMAFHPLVDLLQRQFGVEEGDGEAAIAAKIERGVTAVGAALGPVAPYLRALLSIDPGDADVRAMSPAQRRGETFEALRRLLVHAADQRPQVLVIEDLHWIDGASEQFLTALVDSVPALRALLIFTHRPGYASPFGERTYFTRVVPAALSAEDSARMAAAVLATDALPAELRALVAAKAEGNPFYVEELVKSLEETGILRAEGRAVRARQARDRAQRAGHDPRRHRRAYRPAGGSPQANAPARLGDRARVHPAPRRPPRGGPGAERRPAARAHDARADPRAPPLPRACLHVQARADAGRGLRLAPRPAAQGASRPDRPRHRGAVPRPASRALRDARPPLLARRRLGAGTGLSAQGGREGEPGVRAAPGARPLRRGARGRPTAGRAGAGHDLHGHSSGARRPVLRDRRL